MSRFARRRELAPRELELLASIEAQAEGLAGLIEAIRDLGDDREGPANEAMHALETAVMWAARAIASGAAAAAPGPKIVSVFKAASGEERFQVHDAADKPLSRGLLTREQAEAFLAELNQQPPAAA